MSQDITTTQTKTQTKSLIESIQAGDPTTLEEIKQAATGPLIAYAIKCIDGGDTKRSDATLRLVDLLYKHTAKGETSDPNSNYKDFLEGLKG